MPSPNWNNDDELLADLCAALRPVAVDEGVRAAGRAAFAWRDIDLELARMLFDSYLDEAVSVRGHAPGSPRTLVFRGDDGGVEIEVTDAGIEGQLVPPVPGTVTLVAAAGARATAPADEVGCFTFPFPGRGPLRLECTAAGHTFATEWITV